MPLGAALIAGGSALLGGGMNALSTSNLNRQNRQFAWDMYDRQRGDAYNDWVMQNEYNSPQAQMARFEAAGLNRNLIYGNLGGAGNAGAVAAPNPQSAATKPPEWGGVMNAVPAALSAYYDLDIKEAQVDNLRAQNSVILQDALLKASQIENTKSETDRRRFDLGFETDMRETSADARKEALRSLRSATDISIRKDYREAIMMSSNLNEAMERIASMRVQRINTGVNTEQSREEIKRIRESVQQMQLDGTLKKLDIALRRQGIMPHDPMYARIGARLVPDLIDKGKSAFDEFGKAMKWYSSGQFMRDIPKRFNEWNKR